MNPRILRLPFLSAFEQVAGTNWREPDEKNGRNTDEKPDDYVNRRGSARDEQRHGTESTLCQRPDVIDRRELR